MGGKPLIEWIEVTIDCRNVDVVADFGKTRVHLDLRTDDLPAALGRIRALGGECTGEIHVYDDGTVAVMADPEGTEFCLLGPPGSVLE